MMKLTLGTTVAVVAIAATSLTVKPVQAQVRTQPQASYGLGLTYPQRVQVWNWIRWRSLAYAHAVAQEQRAAQRDVVADWADLVSPYGLKRGDAVDALTAYLVQNWQSANSVDTITRAQVLGVRKQVANLFASNPNLKILTPQQRQQMADSLIYRQMSEDAAYQDAVDSGNTKLLQQYSDASEKRFLDEMHLDLRAFDLTSTGLTKTLIRPADGKARSK